MELITLTTKTRGRNSRDVEYQGIGRVEKDEQGVENVVTDGTLKTFEEALDLPGIEGNVQKALDIFSVGYNKYRRDSALDVDEFAEFIGQLPDEMQKDEKKLDAFKRSVRALAKVAEIELADAADTILAKMKKAAVTA